MSEAYFQESKEKGNEKSEKSEKHHLFNSKRKKREGAKQPIRAHYTSTLYTNIYTA